MREPSFATDASTAAYYDQRAAEYDEWYESAGLFADRDRPGWRVELEQVVTRLRPLPSMERRVHALILHLARG